MQKTILALIFGIAGCTQHTGAPAPATPVELKVDQTEVTPGSVRLSALGAFRPIVDAIDDTTGVCRRIAPTPDGVRRIIFVSPNESSPRRTSLLALNATGEVLQYSERRGDIRGKGAEPVSSFEVDYFTGRASATNERSGTPVEMATGTASELTGRTDFRITQMMELVRRQCIRE